MSTFAVPSNNPIPTPPAASIRPPAPPPAPKARAVPIKAPIKQAESDSEDSEDEDDPIVKRLPVYYTPHYLGSLTLLQFMDRQPLPQTVHPLLPPSLRPTASPAPKPSQSRITARYKPRSQHLEITVPTETLPERWNQEEAAVMGQGVVEEKAAEAVVEKKRGKKKAIVQLGDDDDEEKRILDHLIYSSHVVPDATNYLVGVVKDSQYSLFVN